LESKVVATVAFSVEPSHSPSGCLTPSVSIPSATTQQRPFELDAVEHQHGQAQIRERPRHELEQVLARARDELARNRRLARRAPDVVDLGAGGLAGPRVAARRDAGEHPLEDDLRERVAGGEVPVRLKRQLALVVGRAHPGAADRHAPAAERDLPVLVAVTHRGPVGVVLALRTDDLVDLGLHDLVQHPHPDADAQRQQPLLRRTGQLAQRLLHPRGQAAHRLLVGGDLAGRYGPHRGGSSCPRWTCSHSPRSHGTGRGGRTAASSSTDYGTTSLAGLGWSELDDEGPERGGIRVGATTSRRDPRHPAKSSRYSEIP
jgi:hypothetical protein